MISLSGHPEQFFDRVDRGDEIWQAVVADPVGEVEYALVENNSADLILDAYPGALDGEVPILQKVVGNDRYTLFKVTDEAVSTTDEGTESGSGTAGSTIPSQDGSVGSAPPISTTPPAGSEP